MSVEFCKLLNEAIKDEKEAKLFYSKLMKLAPGRKNKETIRHIRKEERVHKDLLKYIKRNYCR